MRIAIAYGSKHGGSKGIAEQIATCLTEAGHEVDLRSGQEFDGLAGYDAAIVGGGLYANHWVRAARRFVQRHVDELRSMPVWMFSSGPLDDSASATEIPPTAPVARLLTKVGARGHVTFGGRLESDAKGFIARAMVEQGRGGDFRDMQQVSAWAREIADELERTPARATLRPWAAERPLRRALVGLCLFTGITAIGGGIELMALPQGSELMPPVSLLDGTPFSSFFVPGVLLAGIIGLGNAAAGVLALRRHRAGPLAGLAAGIALTVWLIVELALIRTVHWLHALYFVVAAATIVVAALLERRRRAAQPRPIRQHPTPAMTSWSSARAASTRT